MTSAKKRHVFLDRMNHRLLDDLDPRFVEKSRDFSDVVWNKPGEMCRVIASQVEYDGKSVSVAEAMEILRDAVFGVVISFVPGKLACYKDEAPADPLWLVRRS